VHTPAITSDQEYTVHETEHTYAKVTWKIVPLLFICYVVSYLDRINVGFAQLQMKSELGFSDTVYGLGAGIFFIGYFMFEVPSNLILEKIGARLTLFRIMFVWGLLSAGMAFISSPIMLYVIRFLLGVFEAGFFPGVILYLTYWFLGSRRARIIAMFMSAIAMAGVLGGPISGWIMNDMAGVAGLSGWQWMFILEGLPATFLGIFVFFYLDDRPEDTKWLTRNEQGILPALCSKRTNSAIAPDRPVPLSCGHGHVHVRRDHLTRALVAAPTVAALKTRWQTFRRAPSVWCSPLAVHSLSVSTNTSRTMTSTPITPTPPWP